jgi:hypothetical protein
MNLRPVIARLAAAAAVLGLSSTLVGCAFMHPNYPEGRKGAKYLDARQPSTLPTTGVESSDVITACDSVVSKLLSEAKLTSENSPPRYRVSSEDFVADLQTPFDTKALADRVRDTLVNESRGRVRVLHESAGEGDVPADYVLGARVTSVSQTGNGVEESYTQIAFHVIDPLTKDIVFSDLYSVKKAGKGTSAWH